MSDLSFAGCYELNFMLPIRIQRGMAVFLITSCLNAKTAALGKRDRRHRDDWYLQYLKL